MKDDVLKTAIDVTDSVIKSSTIGNESTYDENIASVTRTIENPTSIGVIGFPHSPTSLRYLPSFDTVRCFEATTVVGKDSLEPQCPLCDIGVPTKARRCYEIDDSSYGIFDLVDFITKVEDVSEVLDKGQPVLRKDTDFTKLPKYKLVPEKLSTSGSVEYSVILCSSEKSYSLKKESECSKNRADRRSSAKKYRKKNNKEKKTEEFWNNLRSAEPLCYDT